MDIFGTAIAYRNPFRRFPNLKHHAHPFFVIHNALPKLQQHSDFLPKQYLDLMFLMQEIQAIWLKRLTSTRRFRKFDDDDDDNDDNDGKDDTLKRVTRSMKRDSKLPSTSRTKISKGHGKARRHGKTAPALPASQASNVDSSSNKAFLYDERSEVTAWTVAVSAAGSAEPTDDTITWSDEEPVRPPIRKWDKWHVPYRQPQEHAEFCSSDWPMYFYSYALWMPSDSD